MGERRSKWWFQPEALVGAALSWFVVPCARAQQPADGTVPFASVRSIDATAGSPTERTLLLLNLLGAARPSRAFGVRAGTRWDSTIAGAQRRRDSAGHAWRWLDVDSPLLRTWVNTGEAHADRDGAVWQGRGVTAALSGGLSFHAGMLTVAVRPVVFASQNAAYVPDFGTITPAFREPLWGETIDLPYRFGSRAYAAIDAGESGLRVAVWRTAAGFATGAQRWGPANFYPLILGTEAAGFPRAFLETSDLPIWIGNVSAQWIVGALEGSNQTGLSPGARSRVASGALVAFTPAILPGLEIGGTRFFHVRRFPGTMSWATATLPFSGLLKKNSRDSFFGGANQLASLFARVAPPSAGIEAYVEFLRDDHNADERDFTLEPDHVSAYMIGMTRVWRTGSGIKAFTIENANGRFSHLERVRPQAAIYTHTAVTEGHTYRGQPLGSSAVFAGGGTTLAFERVRMSRSLHIALEIRADGHNGEGGTASDALIGRYALTAGRTQMLRGRLAGWSATLAPRYGFRAPTALTISASLR